jgi:hypothetical protein
VNKFHKLIVQLQTCRILSSRGNNLGNFDSIQAAQEVDVAILFHATKLPSWKRGCVYLLNREEELFSRLVSPHLIPCDVLIAAQEKLGA